MTRVRDELTSRPSPPSADRSELLTAIGDALSDGHAVLVDALTHDAPEPRTTATALLDRAARILRAVARFSSLDVDAERGRSGSAAALASELKQLENAILEGETTYGLDAVHAQRPLDHAVHALMQLHDASRPSIGDGLALRSASGELAALLVRAAANLETTGNARHGAAEGSASLSATVDAIVATIAGQGDALPASEREEDQVGRRLCECLRVRVDITSLDALSRRPQLDNSRRDALDATRHAWTALAVREYAVATTLDARLPSLHYKLEYGSLANAIAAGAVNVLCGARLVLRPDAFHHRRAWGRQGIALSHAIQAYINSLHGDRDALAQAQLIVMSRLLRSIAALTLVDAQRHNLAYGGNGRTRR